MSVTTPEREPCSACGEPVALEARLCPHCDTSALVDLRLLSPIPDPRKRYQVARAIAGLGPPALPFVTLQSALASPPAVVAREATRAFGRRLEAALAPFEVTSDAVSRGRPRRTVSGRNIAFLSILGLLVVGVVWIARHPASWSPAGVRRQAKGAEAPPSASPLSGPVLASRALPSTASLRCTRSEGAGFFVAPDLVLTNAHVLCPPTDTMQVFLANGRHGTAETVRSDERIDLALVRVSGATGVPLPLGDAGALHAGERVVLMGSPVGMAFTYHEGIVSNPARPILGVSYVQVDARINPGNSGGPLLDERGRVVGIVSLKRADAEGIGMALPINYSYTGDDPMVSPPASVSSGFQAMVAAASEEESQAARELGSVEMLPLLVAGRVDGGRIVAGILRPGRGTPAPENFSFHFVRAGAAEALCPLSGMVTDWRVLEGSELSQSLSGRGAQWIQKNGLDARLYYGEASIPWTNCRREDLGGYVSLELEGADPGAARLPLR